MLQEQSLGKILCDVPDNCTWALQYTLDSCERSFMNHCEGINEGNGGRLALKLLDVSIKKFLQNITKKSKTKPLFQHSQWCSVP